MGIPGRPNDAERQGLQNASFHVLRDRRLFATVPLVADGTHVLAGVTNHPFVGCLPAEICFAGDAHAGAGEVRSVLACILHVARTFGVDSVLLAERLGDPICIQSALDASHLYSCEIWTRPVVELEKDEAVLASQVRKSYRSLITKMVRNDVGVGPITGMHCESAVPRSRAGSSREAKERLAAVHAMGVRVERTEQLGVRDEIAREAGGADAIGDVRTKQSNVVVLAIEETGESC